MMETNQKMAINYFDPSSFLYIKIRLKKSCSGNANLLGNLFLCPLRPAATAPHEQPAIPIPL
jgi:hypothetical protein